MKTIPVHLIDPDLCGYGYRDHTRNATIHLGPPRRVRPGGNLYHPALPPNTIYVGRPGPWGNRHPAGKPCKPCGGTIHTVAEAIAAHRRDLRNNPALVARARRMLFGRNLACWCPIGSPCHGDTWLHVVAGGRP